MGQTFAGALSPSLANAPRLEERYRWGEDGLAGISDDKQRLCLALALWNERDPILKERLFGSPTPRATTARTSRSTTSTSTTRRRTATNAGSTSTRRSPYPYDDLVMTNRSRSRHEFEYELIDTGVFDDGRYSTSRSSTPRRGSTTSSAASRSTTGARERALHVLPTLWFRNTWSWLPDQPEAEALTRRRRPHPRGARRARGARGALPARRAEACAAVLRERDQCRGAIRTSTAPRRSPRMASASTSCTEQTPSILPARGPRPPRTCAWTYRPAARRRCSSA